MTATNGFETAGASLEYPASPDIMISFLIYWLVQGCALFVAAHVVPGVTVRSYATLVIAALVLGLVNALVRPVLFVLSLPITVLTLGLFYLVVNGACFMLAAALVPGFQVAGCGSGILGALVMSITAWLIGLVVYRSRRPATRRDSSHS